MEGGGVPDETDAALAAFGLVREGDEKDDAPFKVFSINWPTLVVFWATWNQWHKIAVGNQVLRDGMDWAQVESAMKLSGIKRKQWPFIFEGLRAMETEALNYLNRD